MKLRNMVHNYAHRGHHCRHKVLRLYRANGVIMGGRSERVYTRKNAVISCKFHCTDLSYPHITN